MRLIQKTMTLGLVLYFGNNVAVSGAGTEDSSSNQQKQLYPRGVDPALAKQYQPNNANNFVCLDGSLEIPFARVNDDYCDCPDGSDEPGTSACNNGSFYCVNKGHVPARLSSKRVNDGVCDYDVCCDGTDEWDHDNGAARCPDKCAEIGAERRALEEAEQRVRALGSQKRAQIAFEAKELRREKEVELAHKASELDELTARLAKAEELKNELEEKQRLTREASDKSRDARKQTLEDDYLVDIVTYRKALSHELHRKRLHRDTLILMLRSVREKHNAEYNDGAVKEALAKYAEFIDAYPYMEQAALEYADEDEKSRTERQLQMDRDNEAQDDISVAACCEAVGIYENELETLGDDITLLYELLDKLRANYDRNYHDLAVKAADVGLGEFELTRDRDQAAVDAHNSAANIDTLRERVAEAKQIHEDLANAADDSPDEKNEEKENDATFEQKLASARTDFWDLQSTKNTLSGAVSNMRELLEKDLGPSDIYLPYSGKCFSLDTGEYTYELCLLDRASQVGNKDSARQGLGSFSGFGSSGSDGSADYTVMKFTGGTKCWNGPERSITATFECAEDIKVVSVSEPEKCEYLAKMTGPFACPVDDKDGADSIQSESDNTSNDSTSASDSNSNAEVVEHKHDEL